MSYQKLRAHMVALIAKHGIAVNPVMPHGDTPPFAYTMGLYDKGLPELLVFGLPHQVAGGLLYALAAHLEKEKAEGNPTGPGAVTLEGVAVATALIEVPAQVAREFATVADDLSKGKAMYLQAVWPTPDGLYPWDAGYPEEFRHYQRILGTPPDVTKNTGTSTVPSSWTSAPGRHLH